ncbi:uncharacterized protein MONBRDRAFT_10213 [Monosiga brevicollis MX1]|uniref:Protein SSUH2 homolog n=1 Tax=Monosiga brevicollis TaxID=81824 RepID=A9V5J5_MONBE|nr:uncharacterized protein MONBRDRAFT_10213 [Monosiga brevicollis MX1]EDQ87381.1 predicted protein [Monosiga brevicollis MX1]|eukprot:XP_001747994.1 hypothetical protein [Monosiga brevicollis MX1]
MLLLSIHASFAVASAGVCAQRECPAPRAIRRPIQCKRGATFPAKLPRCQSRCLGPQLFRRAQRTEPRKYGRAAAIPFQRSHDCLTTPRDDHDVCAVIAPPSEAPVPIAQIIPNAFRPEPTPTPTEEELKDALKSRMDEACCAGTKAAQEMNLRSHTSNVCYVYEFKSFTEKRSTRDRTVPYAGQDVDGPERGLAPHPWAIGVMTPHPFVVSEDRKPVPHTSRVHACNNCAGLGNIMCTFCQGRGRSQCTFCNGIGRRSDGQPCSSCHSSGVRVCHTCNGSGRRMCSRCRGSGRLMTYLELIVTWSVHDSQKVFDEDAFCLPLDKVIQGQGRCVYQEQDAQVSLKSGTVQRVHVVRHLRSRGCLNVQVMALVGSPLPKIDAVASSLVQQHRTIIPSTERVLLQRQTVHAIPITHVTAHWNGKDFQYWMYGLDGKVHAPDYPQSCCCGCTIL